ncbi:zinc-binding dehydrogenase [Streptomyces sp. 2MCAF27]
MARLLDLARTGGIEPSIAAHHPLAKAADVHAALERREITGKIVLTTS